MYTPFLIGRNDLFDVLIFTFLYDFSKYFVIECCCLDQPRCLVFEEGQYRGVYMLTNLLKVKVFNYIYP